MFPAAFLRSQRFEGLEVPPSVKAVLTKPSDEDQWENLEKLVECLRDALTAVVSSHPGAPKEDKTILDEKAIVKLVFDSFGAALLPETASLRTVARKHLDGEHNDIGVVCDALFLNCATLQYYRMCKNWEAMIP